MSDLDETLQFIRQCREMGAVDVQVGDVRVTFRGARAQPEREPEKNLTPAERRAREKARREAEDDLTYWSAE